MIDINKDYKRDDKPDHSVYWILARDELFHGS